MDRIVLSALIGTLALTSPVAAQVAWDSPPLVSPVAPGGAGVYFLRADGGRLGVLTTFRPLAGPAGVGFRFAVTEETDPGDVAIAGGIDVGGYLARGLEESEVAVSWWSGLGLSHGNETAVSIPLGLVLGWSGEGDSGVVFSPYAGAHVAFDFVSGPANDVDFNGAVDVGTDIVLTSGWVVRAAATLGDREALALGFRWPG